MHLDDGRHHVVEDNRRFRGGAADAIHPAGHDVLNRRLALCRFHLRRERHFRHSLLHVLRDGVGREVLEEQLPVQVRVTRAFFQDDVLQVLGHRVPAVGVHREPTVTHGYDWPHQVVGHFIPAQAVSAGTAGDCAVDYAALQRRVHVGERDELWVCAHAGQQVAQHRAVAAYFETLQIFQPVNLRLGEDVVVRRHHVGNLDAAVFQSDLGHLGLDGVNHVQLVLLGCEQAPQVAHVHDGEVAAHVAGVDLRRVQRAVLNQAQRVRAGDAEFGEG